MRIRGLLPFMFCAGAFAQTPWVALPGTTFTSTLCPPDGGGGVGSVDGAGNPYAYRSGGGLGANTNCSGAVRAWNGGAARTKAGSEAFFLLSQGGHADYGGNEDYKLTLTGTPTFNRISNPSTLLASYFVAIGGICPAPSYPDGKPAARHRYGGITYVKNLDKFFLWGGAPWCDNSKNPMDAWWYDPAAADPQNAYTKVTYSSAGGCVVPIPSNYNTTANQTVNYNANDGMVYISMGGNFWKFNPATSCLASLGSNVTQTWQVTAIWDTARNRLFELGGSEAWAVSTTGTAINLTASINANCNTIKNDTGPGGFYDAVADKYVWYPHTAGNSLYIMDPTSYSCTIQTTTGGPTSGAVTGMWNRFDYFPSLGKIAVLPDYGQTWYTLDYAAVAPSSANTLTIKNEGTTTTNYPVQIGRAFVQGEIPLASSPQAWVGNTAVPTQVDVKARWTDGSLKHAIISFLVPTFTNGVPITITLAPGTTVGNTALTQAQMLAVGYNFDAVTSLTNGATTRTASARTMLTNGDYTVWASGPIATTILLGHHAQGFACPAGVASGAGSVSSKYDFGMNTHCAFRPLFEATFWAGTNQVRVRFIGEIANTEQLEDVATTSMSLTTGSTSPTTVYTRGALTMNAGSRWTKVYWLGGTPPVASYNHNLAYIASTKALPNYDTTKTVTSSNITSSYTSWTSLSATARDMYGYGLWDHPSFGGSGAHDHVGPYPKWISQWIYTGDYRMQEVAIGQAEIFSNMEWHLREGKAGKKLDRAGLVSGIGYPISISTRPTFNFFDAFDNTNTFAAANDKVTPIGTASNSGSNWDASLQWKNMVSHQPEIFYPTYLLTGEHFFLEEGQFQTAFGTTFYVVPGVTDWRSRGPTGAEGNIPDKSHYYQMRGVAWTFRNRVETAFISPDNDPFKTYLEQLTADVLATWEGQRNITTGAYNGSTMWTYGRTMAISQPNGSGTVWDSDERLDGTITAPSPLHFWDNGNVGICDSRIQNLSLVADCNSPWHEQYVLYALGRAAELGYPATALRNWLGDGQIGALTDAGYNPWLAGAFRSNIIKPGGTTYFTTWAEAKTAYISTVQNETSFEPGAIGTSSGANNNKEPIVAAISMVADQTNGSTAWSWVNTNILSTINTDPKWAILPRSTTPVTPPPPTTGTGVTLRGGLRGGIK